MTTIAPWTLDPSSGPLSSSRAVAVRAHTDASPAWWRSEHRDTWVARLGRSALLGTVRRTGPDYLATDRRGAELGHYASLAEAETAVGATVYAVADELDRSHQRVAAIIAASAGLVAGVTAVIGLIVLHG